VPELSDPRALSRSLAFLASSFPGKDPVLLLQENPQLLLNLSESNMEDSAEVGRGVLGWSGVDGGGGDGLRERWLVWVPMCLSLCVVPESHMEDSTELGAGE
jgi:hypothetical protein